VHVRQSKAWIFEKEQQLRAERSPGNRSGNGGPAQRGREGISEAAAKGEIDGDSGNVGRDFEEEMRMDCIRPDVKVDRKGGMGCGKDGEL